MSALAEFLLARIAEDEHTAEYADLDWPSHHMLAECEAKRRILELHGAGSHECPPSHQCSLCLPAEDCTTVLLLAAVYANHPDYCEEWRP